MKPWLHEAVPEIPVRHGRLGVDPDRTVILLASCRAWKSGSIAQEFMIAWPGPAVDLPTSGRPPRPQHRVVPRFGEISWLATSPGGRSGPLPAAGAAERVDVPLEPRCCVRITAAKNVVVPEGVLLRFANPFDPELDTWHPFRPGADNLVAPDASGTTTVSLWVMRRDRTRLPLDVAWTVELPAGDREVSFELALDAEQVQAIVELRQRLR